MRLTPAGKIYQARPCVSLPQQCRRLLASMPQVCAVPADSVCDSAATGRGQQSASASASVSVNVNVGSARGPEP
jgi:hypothetical protein